MAQDDDEKQATAKSKQQRKTSNGEKQATAKTVLSRLER
jgi:hypothetical protein